MPRLDLKVVETISTDVTIVTHAISVRTTMLILVLFVEFPTFSNHKITHKASFYSVCPGKSCLYPNTKVMKIS